MGKRKREYFWHVPPGTWYTGSPVVLAGNGNVVGDIVVPLVDSETTIAIRPQINNYVVERIVGQYMFTADESAPTDRFIHSRVYVADADATSVALRTLDTVDDAETSFLWHQVDPWAITYDTDTFGTWQQSGGGNPQSTPWQGRQGHIDIRVGRRIEGGTSLIWHSQLEPAPPANDTFFLKLWLRFLVREAGGS